MSWVLQPVGQRFRLGGSTPCETSQLSRSSRDAVGVVARVKQLVPILAEELAILLVLVGAADLLADVPADAVQQPRLVLVLLDALLEKVDAANHVGVAVVVVVELGRDVVRKIVRLIVPDLDRSSAAA